jgi:predicted dehydrogenase
VTRTSADSERAMRGDGAVTICRQLAAHIREGEPLAVTDADALRAATVMDAIRESDATGASVRVA